MGSRTTWTLQGCW